MPRVLELRTVLCTTPGCPNDAHARRQGWPFCDSCLRSLRAKELRASAQRAEMRRQADLQADDLSRKREQHVRTRKRIIDGRTRAILQLQRLRDQADRRGDQALARALNRAHDSITAALAEKAS